MATPARGPMVHRRFLRRNNQRPDDRIVEKTEWGPQRLDPSARASSIDWLKGAGGSWARPVEGLFLLDDIVGFGKGVGDH